MNTQPIPNPQRNPPDGPYNAHFQGGVWRIFNVDNFVDGELPKMRLEDALKVTDRLNTEHAALNK